MKPAQVYNWLTANGHAEEIPDAEQLATKKDLAQLETRIVKTGIGLVALAVVLNNFLAWVIR